MIVTRGLARLGAALGLFAFVLGLSAAFASTTSAQAPTMPATFYGPASAGDVVEAFIDGASCGTARIDSGTWIIQIGGDAPCDLVAGDEVSFTLNGSATNETATWNEGATPAGSGYSADPGITLTLAEAPAPAAPETGNAGLLAAGQGSSPWLALSLGVLALAMVAGARAATGWQRGRVRYMR